MVLNANDFKHLYKPVYDCIVLTCKKMKYEEYIYYKYGCESLINYFKNIDDFSR